jgi:hypothetical protein
MAQWSQSVAGVTLQVSAWFGMAYTFNGTGLLPVWSCGAVIWPFGVVVIVAVPSGFCVCCMSTPIG